MPEEPEIETEKLREAVHEELEEDDSGFLRRIALTTALLAVLAAVASLQAGDTVNEALVLKAELARLQAQASDQWAYYQAKGIKGAVSEAAANAWAAAGRPAPSAVAGGAQRYASEQAAIRRTAETYEKERDRRSDEADRLLERHHGFANSVGLFQVAIALGAVAALTRQKLIWWGSVLLGAGGTALLVLSYAPG